MLQLYFANIDFLFLFCFMSQLVLLFLKYTLRCLFSFVLLLSRENLNMHFVPFINTFTLFFWFGLFYRHFSLSWERVCVCLTIICLVELFPSVSVCSCYECSSGNKYIRFVDNKVGRF